MFIDGCFWHGCPAHGTTAFGTNSAFCTHKIRTNAARDLDTTTQLEDAGWHVLRVWEHVDPRDAADEIEALVLQLKTSSGCGLQ